MRISQLFGPSTSERPGSQTTCVRGRRPGQGAKERGPLEDAGRIWAALHQGLCLLRYPRRGRVRACDDGEEHWHEGDCRREGAPQEPPAAGRFQERQACDHREGGACRSVRWPPAAPVRSPARFTQRTFVGVLCGAWQVLQDLSGKQHPYIVSLHHSFQDDSHLYLVMDFVGGGLHACAIIGTIGVGPRRCFGSGLLMALGRANLERPPAPLPMHAAVTARGITLPRAKV